MSFAQPTHLTRDQIDAFEREVNAIRDSVMTTLGQRDVDHIRRQIRILSLIHISEPTRPY